jgi:hypothetical protein
MDNKGTGEAKEFDLATGSAITSISLFASS